MSIIFNTNANIENKTFLIFLCGIKFPKKDELYDNDKRIVLKNFLEKKKNIECLILEESFDFSRYSDIIKYQDIGLYNLNDIELLAALVSDSIFIIHESYSTAGEVALFAANENVYEKTLVLIPDRNIVDEDKYSGFLRYAFSFGGKRLLKTAIFYPEFTINAESEYNYKKYTYFPKNIIGENLAKHLNRFISIQKSKKQKLLISQATRGKLTDNYISYKLIHNEKKILIRINPNTLKYYIISLFNLSDLRKKIREMENKKLAILEIYKKFEEVLKCTIIEQTRAGSSYKIRFEKINISNNLIEVEKAVSFIVYTLHALGYLKLSDEENTVIIGKYFGNEYRKYENLLIQKKNIKVSSNG